MALTDKTCVEAFIAGSNWAGEAKRWSVFSDARGSHIGALLKDRRQILGPFDEAPDQLQPVGFHPTDERAIYLDVESPVPVKGHRAAIDRIALEAIAHELRVVPVSAERLAELRGVADG